MRKHHIDVDKNGRGRKVSHQQWVIALQNLATELIRKEDYELARVIEKASRRAANEGEAKCLVCLNEDKD